MTGSIGGRASTGERGSAGVGLAVGSWCLIVMMMFGAGAVRLTAIRGEVAAAARVGARAAAGARDRAAGLTIARAAAGSVLPSDCVGPTVRIDGDHSPGGWVTVTVTCGIELGDVAPAGFPGRTTITRSSTEPIDTIRGG